MRQNQKLLFPYISSIFRRYGKKKMILPSNNNKIQIATTKYKFWTSLLGNVWELYKENYILRVIAISSVMDRECIERCITFFKKDSVLKIAALPNLISIKKNPSRTLSDESIY